MKWVVYLFFSLSFLWVPLGAAQDSSSSSDSGVLVSSPAPTKPSDQGTTGGNGAIIVSNSPQQDQAPQKAAGAKGSSAAGSNSPVTNAIVAKATDVVMFQITANMKLTQDQINVIRPIITDNIVKVRDLRQKLADGTIDSKTMYNQRQQLAKDEYQALSAILSADQMKVWINLQNQ